MTRVSCFAMAVLAMSPVCGAQVYVRAPRVLVLEGDAAPSVGGTFGSLSTPIAASERGSKAAFTAFIDGPNFRALFDVAPDGAIRKLAAPGDTLLWSSTPAPTISEVGATSWNPSNDRISFAADVLWNGTLYRNSVSRWIGTGNRLLLLGSPFGGSYIGSGDTTVVVAFGEESVTVYPDDAIVPLLIFLGGGPSNDPPCRDPGPEYLRFARSDSPKLTTVHYYDDFFLRFAYSAEAPITQFSDYYGGVWTDQSLNSIFQSPWTIPQLPNHTSEMLSSPYPTIDGDGGTAFVAIFRDSNGFDARDVLLYQYEAPEICQTPQNSTLTTIAYTGGPAPGLNQQFGSIRPYPILNSAGQLFFFADSCGSSGCVMILFQYDPLTSTFSRLVGYGDAAPGTSGTFSGFEPDVIYANPSCVIFVASASDDTVGAWIFAPSLGGLAKLVARNDPVIVNGTTQTIYDFALVSNAPRGAGDAEGLRLPMSPLPAAAGDLPVYALISTNTNLQAIVTFGATDYCGAVDLDQSGNVDFNDYLEFLNLFNSGDPRADFNLDGSIDFNDYLEFLNRLNACS